MQILLCPPKDNRRESVQQAKDLSGIINLRSYYPGSARIQGEVAAPRTVAIRGEEMSITWKVSPESSLEEIRAAQWVRNPLTQEKEKILDAWVSENPVICPTCHFEDKHTFVITPNTIALGCKVCKQFHWYWR